MNDDAFCESIVDSGPLVKPAVSKINRTESNNKEYIPT
jgi:hypothetical protein